MTATPMNRRLKISQVDAMFADGIYPIEFFLFFERAFDLDRLRSALCEIRGPFWPAFGSFRDGHLVDDGTEADDSYVEERVEEALPDPGDETERLQICRAFGVGPTDRPFTLKVVRFNNGLALIPRLSHLVGDGYSYFYLLSTLSHLTRPAAPGLRSLLSGVRSFFERPHHGRTAVREFEYVDRGSRPRPAPPSNPRIVHERIAKAALRAAVKGGSADGEARISTNDLLSAIALKRLIAEDRSRFGQEVSLTIPIDVRARVGEYGARFFGNGIMLHEQTFGIDQIDSDTPDSIARSIRRAFPEVSEDTFHAYLVGLEERMNAENRSPITPFDPERGCLVTNLSRLPTDRLDFGSGSPRLVINLTTERNAVVVLTDGADQILRMAL